MEINFSGKRALVTGAAQGIGLAVVKKLVSCGAKVVALDVKEEQLIENLKELPGVETIVADLRNWDATLDILKSIGQVQLVVNNAGVHAVTTVQVVEEADVNRIFDVNIKAMMAVCKHVVNDLTSAGVGGAIVNMASVIADHPDKFSTAYCGSKAAVVQYTRCLALDCAPKGIRVNTVSPGLVKTEMTDIGLKDPQLRAIVEAVVPTKEKYCDPEDIANAVAFLLCDDVARRITGADLIVDSGLTLT